VIGDSLADWLAYGMDEFYTDHPEIGIERKIAPTSGLIRYDTKNDQLEWWQAIKDTLVSEKPDAIVVMLGLNDRLPLRYKTPLPPTTNRPGESAQGVSQRANKGANQETNQGANKGTNPASQMANQSAQDKAAEPTDVPSQSATQTDAQHPAPGGSYDFHTDQWAELYGKRIDEMIAALKSKGVPVIWIGLPAIRGTKATSDLGYLDELYREHAEKADIVYVDIWDGFIDDQGRYAVEGPDYAGQTRRLRSADGVHFTQAGAVKLASYVDRDLRRVLSNHVLPVALPGPETAPQSGSAGGRPDVGPVLPLSTGGGEHGDLLGAGDHPTQMTSDPTPAKFLSRGEALPTPAGRADDFSWPRSDTNVSATPEASPQPVGAAPSTSEKSNTAARDDTKKITNAEQHAKGKSASDTSDGKTRHAPNTTLDGAPVAPTPVGSR
jgi:lysophospholipase L1-like esterase